jgi:2-oxoglutarate ferredoxin oxidoreductase subunit beta
MIETRAWSSTAETTWCPGCGNFGILTALRQALTTLKFEPTQVVVVAGIGQAGKTAHYLGCNYLHGLHGRALAHALGVKLSNHALKVVAIGGDGDMYSEGGNHLLNAFRRNAGITCLVHDNGVYGLTKGQSGPTSSLGYVTKNVPEGTRIPAFNPLATGLAMNGTFIARGFAGDTRHLSRLLAEALSHRGFGFVDILQPCVTYNHVNTLQWYKERVYDLAASGHDPSSFEKARQRALEWPNAKGEDTRIPIGVLYRAERPVYEESIPALRKQPLVQSRFDPADVRKAAGEFL